MMNSLNDLFAQILHSEEHFSKRISRLRQLRACIQECQRDLQKVRSRCGALQGELVVKNQRLADCEIRMRLHEVKKNVLEEQKSDLMKEKQQLSDNLATVLQSAEQQREEFLSEVKDFNKGYDITGTGVEYRGEQAKKRVAVLEEELELLATEYSEIEIQQSEVDKLELQLASVNKRLDDDNDQQRELKTILQGLRSECSQLRNSSTANFNDDTEFTRLQREIEACRNSSEEIECHHLSKELENLQRMSYQKRMKYHSFPKATKRRGEPTDLQSSHSAHQNLGTGKPTSERGVVDDEWMSEEGECEDWELEALAEASELTALDLDDDSDVCILDDEEEEESACDNFTVNLKRRPLHSKGPPRSKGLVKQPLKRPSGETSQQQLSAPARAELSKSSKRVRFNY